MEKRTEEKIYKGRDRRKKREIRKEKKERKKKRERHG